MKFLILLTSLALCTNAQRLSPQNPLVWDALRQLRGGRDLTVDQIQDIVRNAVPGRDYPVSSCVPDRAINRNSFSQPG